MRKLDHLVMPVHDLDAARATYESLGFRTTPPADHPWGTRNSLVQLDSVFLELLTVVDPSVMEQAALETFSFGAFNRDFLTGGEGISMLVLASEDPAADRQQFERAGLVTYQPFSFERAALQPDGSSKTVAFDLTFTTAPMMPHAAFFTCRNLFPSNFWKPDYQAHPNGIRSVSSVIAVAQEPAQIHLFLKGFADQYELDVTSFGLECALSDSVIEVLTPIGFRAFYGDTLPERAERTPLLTALSFEVKDVESIARRATDAGFDVVRRPGMVIVPAPSAHGSVLIFKELA